MYVMAIQPKKAHTLIGDVKVTLAMGTGKKRLELASRSPSSLRPFVFFRYDATPQMLCVHSRVEWKCELI